MPSGEANICCPCSIEKPLRLVKDGIFSKSKGSKARRATSMGDMEVARTSLVRSSTVFNWSGANRLVSAAKDSGGWLNQSARQAFRPVGVRGADGDHQFPGVGEILLVELETLHGRLIGGQQIEDIDVKAQPPQPETDRDAQENPPPAFQKQTHGARKPSMVSPERVFSSRQPPSGLRSNRKGAGSGAPERAV